MADEQAGPSVRMSPQELVERIMAEQRAKAARRPCARCSERGEDESFDAGFFAPSEVDRDEERADGQPFYEDEPIIKTGTQLLRDREKHAERTERSRESYINQASSSQDAAWRRLMAYGSDLERAERAGCRLDANAWADGRDGADRSFGMDDPDEGGASALSVASSRRAPAVSVPDWRAPVRQGPLFSLDELGAMEAAPVACDLPPLLQELRELEREDAAFLKSRDWLFVRQAKLAANYEDDFAYNGTFQHYFPTYQAMDDRQLRGYFSWRTKVRQGNVRKTPLSFAFVHLYELLNGVGATSPEEGFERLRGFVEAYRAEDARIDRYARTWLHDYVIFHGLDRALLDELDRAGLSVEGEKGSVDEALAVLAAADAGTSGGREPDAPSDERLFAALCALSSYRLDESRFYRDDPELARRAACELWRALGAYFRKHRKRALFESLFGRRFEMPYPLFRSAVFYGETRHADVVYEVSPVRRYRCRSGRWSEEAYHQAPSRSKDLGRILKALDCALRRACESPHQLKPVSVPKYVRDILDGVVGRLLEERRRAEERAQAVRVEIDFSKLQGIRAAAATTRDALLIDEERASEGPHAVSSEGGIAAFGGGQARVGQDCENVIPPGCEMAATEGGGAPCREASPAFASDGPLPIVPPAPAPSMACGAAILQEGNEPAGAGSATERALFASGPAEAESPLLASNPAGLTAEEASYLRCLATGAPAAQRAAVLAQAGTMETLMVDAVNEKLYDLLGDIAVEETDEGFALIEDYEDDVRGMLGL